MGEINDANIEMPSFCPHAPGKEGDGRMIEMYGFGVAVVNDKLQLTDVDIYYKPEPFIQASAESARLTLQPMMTSGLMAVGCGTH